MGASESSVARVEEDHFPLSISTAANFKDSPMHIVQDDGPVCCLLTSKLEEWIPESDFTVGRVCFMIESHDQGWCGENDFLTKYMGSWTWFEVVIVRDFTVPDAHGKPPPSEDIETRVKQAIKERRKSAVLTDTSDVFTVRTSVGNLTTVKNPTKATKDVWHVQRNMRALNENTVYEVFWSNPDLGLHGDMDEMEFTDMTGSGRGIGFVSSLQPTDRIAVIGRAMYPGWTNIITEIKMDVLYSV